jgi:pterin-4a-carbinolamine dehydratase
MKVIFHNASAPSADKWDHNPLSRVVYKMETSFRYKESVG